MEKIDLQESLKVLSPNITLYDIKFLERKKLINGFNNLCCDASINMYVADKTILVEKSRAINYVDGFLNKYRENMRMEITKKKRKLDQEYKYWNSI